MRVYPGGQAVPDGLYLNLSNGDTFESRNDGRILPGKGRFVRLAVGLQALIFPFVGLVYILVIPLMAIGGGLALAVYKIWLALVKINRKLTWPPLNRSGMSLR